MSGVTLQQVIQLAKENEWLYPTWPDRLKSNTIEKEAEKLSSYLERSK
jgi:hypothetical protein